MPTPQDAPARARALTPNQSFIVTAPAGSGKTGLLTQRALLLLAQCQHPEDVLCITFTRKAAAEMRQRLLQALQAATQEKPQNPHDAKTWELARAVLEQDKKEHWQLLQNPSRLRLQTIDGLCRNLSQQLPLASGLGAELDTLENPKAAYESAVKQLLFALENEQNTLHSAIKNLLYRCDNNTQRLENLLTQLLATRDQWLPLLLPVTRAPDQVRPALENYLKTTIVNSLQRCQKSLLPFGSDIALLLDKAAQELQESDPQNPIVAGLGITALPDASLHAIPQWLAIAEFLLTKEGKKYRSAWNKNIGFAAGKTKDEKAVVKQRKEQASVLVAQLQEAGDGLRQQLHGIRQLPPATYSESDWAFLDDLTQILLQLAAHLQIIFGQQGATDFVEVNQAAISALSTSDEEASELLLQLDYRIQHILVDEFQDTSWPQLRLLENLTAGWQPDDGRTLFCVGDGMQSCYGFRGANVGIFLQVRDAGIGDIPLEPLQLTVNFRSQYGVVDWVNQQFSAAFPKSDDTSKGAVKFQLATAFAEPNASEEETQSTQEKPIADICVRSYGFINDDTRMEEAKWVTQQVHQLRAQQPNDSIAILVRTRSHLQPLLGELQAIGLQGQATDIEPLSQRMAIIDVLNLTKAMLNPSDELAWFALLRAPWCGLDNIDLLHIREHLNSSNPVLLLSQWLLSINFKGDIVTPINFDLFEPAETALPPITWPPNLSDVGKQRLESLAIVLQNAWVTRQRKSLRQYIEGIWLALGSSSHLLEASDLRNIHTFFDLLEKYSQQGWHLDWPSFDEAMSRLYAAPSEMADPKLQIMTLHKSKGLEFDHVFIIGLDRASRGDEKALLLWQDTLAQNGEHALILAPLAPIGQTDSPIYTYLKKEKDERQKLEATRLLYVGCTRAIKNLYLTACIKTKESKEETDADVPLVFTVPKSQSLLSSIWDNFKSDMHLCHPVVSPSHVMARPSSGPLNQQNGASTDGDMTRWSHIRRTLAPRPSVNDLHHPLLARYRGTCLSLDNSTEREAPYTGAWASSPVLNPINNTNVPEYIASDQLESRSVGTILHWVLEQIANEGWKQWPPARVNNLAPMIRVKCLEEGIAFSEHEAVSNTIVETTLKMLDSPQGQWILDKHAHNASEWPLLDTRNDNLYVIDRTFVDEDDTRWIIDYKSSQPHSKQSFDAFIQQEVHAYKEQLSRYKKLLMSRESRKIITALYFPTLDKLIQV